MLALGRVWAVADAKISSLSTAPESEWRKRLAVLTADSVYLLDEDLSDALSPFGKVVHRLPLEQLSDACLIDSGTLRLSTSFLLQRHTLLRARDGVSQAHAWLHAIREAMRALLTSGSTSFSQQLEAREAGRLSDVDSAPLPAPWLDERLRPVLAAGNVDKRRDGLLLVGWVERFFVVCVHTEARGPPTALLMYHKRTAEINDELLGELRGVLDLRSAHVERLMLDEGEVMEEEPGSLVRTSKAPPEFLRITAAEVPPMQPFYELPKWPATIDMRFRSEEDLCMWQSKISRAVELASDRLREPIGVPSSEAASEQRARSQAPRCAQPAIAQPARVPSPLPRRVLSADGVAAARGGARGSLPRQLLACALLTGCCLAIRAASDPLFNALLLVANAIAFTLARCERRNEPHAPPPPPDSQSTLRAQSSLRPPLRAAAPPAAGGPPVAGELVAPTVSWSAGDATAFNVRCGPDYPRRGLKAPSASALYELLAVDVFRTPCWTEHLARHVQLPSPAGGGGAAHGHLPPIIIVHVLAPVDAPALIGGTPNGETVSCVFYFGCTPAAQAASRAEEAAAPVQLVRRWYERAPAERMHGVTFKVIALADNLEELGVPRMLHRYNGKPVLIRKSGEMHVGEGYVEIDLHVSRFNYISQSSLHSFAVAKSSKAEMHIGFLLQGTADDELPEQLLGAVRLHTLDYLQVPHLDPTLAAAAAVQSA